MRRDDARRLLREHRAEIDAFGVKSLALFGSVARDEAGPDSDVDVLVEFEGDASYDRYCDLWFYLEDLLGLRTDLVIDNGLRARIRPYVQRDAILVA